MYRFPVVETHRWIWVWMGDPALADPASIPDTQWLDHPRWRSLDGYLHYDVNYLLIADNLLDFSHLPFLHPTMVGGSPDYAAVLPKVERHERGVRLTKWVANTQPPEYSAKYSNYPENARVDRWMYYDFLVPGVLLMDSGMMPAGTGGHDRHREEAIAFRGCQPLTPETDTSRSSRMAKLGKVGRRVRCRRRDEYLPIYLLIHRIPTLCLLGLLDDRA